MTTFDPHTTVPAQRTDEAPHADRAAPATGNVALVGEVVELTAGAPVDRADPRANDRRGRRGLTAGIRRLIDGPQGRHRAGRPTA